MAPLAMAGPVMARNIPTIAACAYMVHREPAVSSHPAEQARK